LGRPDQDGLKSRSWCGHRRTGRPSILRLAQRRICARRALGFAFDDLGLTEVVSFTSSTNLRSQAVMKRINMTNDPADDFDHPLVDEGHLLQRHVLWRMAAERWRDQRSSP
jgi:hypothetical protein